MKMQGKALPSPFEYLEHGSKVKIGVWEYVSQVEEHDHFWKVAEGRCPWRKLLQMVFRGSFTMAPAGSSRNT